LCYASHGLDLHGDSTLQNSGMLVVERKGLPTIYA
jgi:hypothetical protein